MNKQLQTTTLMSLTKVKLNERKQPQKIAYVSFYLDES